MGKIKNATIIVRNYNGKNLLEQLLPSLIEVVRQRAMGDQILVVDDGSSDGSAGFVAETYPEIRLERIDPNSGNSIVPVNRGVRAASQPVVICLDNDVRVAEDFISPLLPHFDDPQVFAVCPKILNPNHGNRVESYNYPVFHRGRFFGEVPGQRDPSSIPASACDVWYAPGNGAAYRKSMFSDMDGLDPMYRPIYYEDVDICHRAWQRGWRSVFEPQATTFHLKHGTTRKNLKKKDHFEIYRQKNLLLFTWKNLLDTKLLCVHLCWTVLHTINALARRDRSFLKSMCWALRQLPEALSSRRIEMRRAVQGSRAVLQHFKKLTI